MTTTLDRQQLRYTCLRPSLPLVTATAGGGLAITIAAGKFLKRKYPKCMIVLTIGNEAMSIGSPMFRPNATKGCEAGKATVHVAENTETFARKFVSTRLTRR